MHRQRRFRIELVVTTIAFGVIACGETTPTMPSTPNSMHLLTVTTAGSGSGTVVGVPGPIDCGATCEASYAVGATIVLTATADGTSRFGGWGGACTGMDTCTVIMDSARQVSASFERTGGGTEHTLTVIKAAGGTVTSAPAGVDCGADCTEDYDDGTTVTLTATADGNYDFTGWSGDCSGTTTTCQVVMSEARTVTPLFTRKMMMGMTFSLTVVNGGNGHVASGQTGIDCGATCTADFDEGELVTLTALPDNGYNFGSWSGACSGRIGVCQVSMTEARTVNVTFVAESNDTHTLTVTNAGDGTVASLPLGIDCGSDCTEDFDDGVVVTLTAVPDANYNFTGWSGDCSGTVSTCRLTMTEALNVTASFVAQTNADFTLTVNTAGNGTVRSLPTGIDCGSDCTEDYEDGTDVTLTAVPDGGNGFSGWTGDCTGPSLLCVVTMAAARNVTATFSEDPIPVRGLTVTVQGNGTVTSFPSGIDCGSDCTEDYSIGALVTLTATPAAGNDFVTWSGDCAGSLRACVVSMTDVRAVTARFSPSSTPVYRLRLTNPGGGTITSAPAGIDCGSDCFEDFDSGEVVTLTAAPAGSYSFDGWDGDCSGTATTCMVTMDQVRDVEATFSNADGTPPGACDSRPAMQLCVEFIGSSYTTSGVQTACPTPPLNYVAECPTQGLYGRCRLDANNSRERLEFHYQNSPGLMQLCTFAGGTWL